MNIHATSHDPIKMSQNGILSVQCQHVTIPTESHQRVTMRLSPMQHVTMLHSLQQYVSMSQNPINYATELSATRYLLCH